jgi:hypothetical protein
MKAPARIEHKRTFLSAFLLAIANLDAGGGILANA